MSFVFPLNCVCRRIGGQLIEIDTLFYITRRPAELHLFPLIGMYLVPRLNEECLKIGNRFVDILLFHGIGPMRAAITGRPINITLPNESSDQ